MEASLFIDSGVYRANCASRLLYVAQADAVYCKDMLNLLRIRRLWFELGAQAKLAVSFCYPHDMG